MSRLLLLVTAFIFQAGHTRRLTAGTGYNVELQQHDKVVRYGCNNNI